MSSDNGIYILWTKGPEYRVAYGVNIDSVYGEFSDDSYQWQGDPQGMYDFFHDAKMFSNLEDALDFAGKIVYDYEYLEDGICVVSDFQDWDFNKLKERYGKEAEGDSR